MVLCVMEILPVMSSIHKHGRKFLLYKCAYVNTELRRSIYNSVTRVGWGVSASPFITHRWDSGIQMERDYDYGLF